MGLNDKPSIPRVANLFVLFLELLGVIISPIKMRRKDKPSIPIVGNLFVLFLKLFVYN